MVLQPLNKASLQGFSEKNIDVKDLADLAAKGNEEAQSTFAKFGNDLAEMLVPYIQQFQANRVIVGGQIAKSFKLFGSNVKQQLLDFSTKVDSLDNALYFRFIGIGELFDSREF